MTVKLEIPDYYAGQLLRLLANLSIGTLDDQSFGHYLVKPLCEQLGKKFGDVRPLPFQVLYNDADGEGGDNTIPTFHLA